MSPGCQRNDEIHRIIREMCGSRRDAAEWFISVIDLTNVWDHIVDGDVLDRPHADGTLAAIFVGWGLNRFYRDHAETLSVVALNAVLAWKSSDIAPQLRVKAFDVVTELGTTVAMILGGVDWARRWSVELRRWAFAKMTENDQPKA